MSHTESPSVLTRAGRLSDVPTIADLYVKSWQRVYEGIMPGPFLDNLRVADREESLTKIITHERHQVHVVCYDNKVVGFSNTGIHPKDPTEAELYAIYLHPEYWGKGLGQPLFKTACQSLRTVGLTRLMLWVATDNLQARKFYDRMGMEADGATKSETFGGTPVEAVRYWMSL